MALSGMALSEMAWSGLPWPEMALPTRILGIILCLVLVGCDDRRCLESHEYKTCRRAIAERITIGSDICIPAPQTEVICDKYEERPKLITE